MRRIVTNSEVAHLWANRSQPEASNSTGSIYFIDDTIYSYGSHFPIARHVNGVVLFTDRTYGNSTAKHINHTRYACNHLTVFTVDNVTATGKTAHKENLADMRSRYESEILAASRARKYGQMHLDNAERIRVYANAYSKLFKLRIRIKPANVEQIAIRAAKQARAEKAARRKLERQQAEMHRVSLAAWRSGEADHLQYAYGQPVAIRLIDDGATVQTSKGARFPAVHAARSLPIVHRCVKQGKAWATNGRSIHLGHYQLDSIAENGDVRAGCHFVKYAEVQHLETLLRGA